jgi:CRISPR-associated protein Cas2
MRILIAYDVATAHSEGQRRLRRVAQACSDYGQRVQKSVFECQLEAVHWAVLRARLLREIDDTQDSLRFYFLDEDTQMEHVGCHVPINLDGPLVV